MRRDLALFIALLYVIPTAMLVGVAVVVAPTGEAAGLFTRDPASLTGTHPLLGVVSNVGVIGWAAAATVCLFVGGMVRQEGASGPKAHWATFLVSAGLITVLLMVDDFFMLHDWILPRYFGLNEKVVFAAYGFLVIGWLVSFRRRIVETDYAALLLSIVFFGFSLVVDFFQPEVEGRIGPWRVLLEDGAKLLGIVGWLGYFILVGLSVRSE